jgi:hypothetical protein
MQPFYMYVLLKKREEEGETFDIRQHLVRRWPSSPLNVISDYSVALYTQLLVYKGARDSCKHNFCSRISQLRARDNGAC